jgi:hypothetical protein
MFPKVLALSIGLFSIGLVHAQDDSTAYVQQEPAKAPIPFKDRLWFGGGLGLNFGTITAVQVDPLLGVYLDRPRKLSTGIGLSYSYYQDNRYVPAYTQNAYGYRLFTRYRVIEQAYLDAEFLHLNTEPYFNNFQDQPQRIWVPHLLLGAGYVQPLGGRTSVYLQVLFEVLQDPNSIYLGQGPIFSGGIGVGF